MTKLKNFALGIGIIIVFALVLWQGIETFYPSPQWDDFCGNIIIPRPVPIEEPSTLPVEEIDYKECQDRYDLEQDAHSKIVFVISIIVGIIAIIIGYTILSIEPVGSALIGSGVWSIFWGSVVNWRNFANLPRFLLLLLVLIILLWLALKLNTKKKKGFWQKLGLRK